MFYLAYRPRDAGAAFFYFVLRLGRLALPRSTKIILYCACIVLACVAWRVQESNASQHSPRRLIVGTVASATANRPKGELLWPDAAPGAQGSEDIDKPTLAPYLVPAGRGTGTAVIV